MLCALCVKCLFSIQNYRVKATFYRVSQNSDQIESSHTSNYNTSQLAGLALMLSENERFYFNDMLASLHESTLIAMLHL